MPSKTFHIFAPAKINLFLHITGKRDDGYHTLQSLMIFADAGDDLEFSSQENFSIEVKGIFTDALPLTQDNLVYKAARLLSEDYKTPLSGKIILTKNLPVASGIGGGSADAAAALKGLSQLWSLPDEPSRLQKVAQKVGADVPACLYCRPVWVEGIGEKLIPISGMPPIYLVLVNPLVPVATAAVFQCFGGSFSPLFPSPREWGMPLTDLDTFRNDLTEAAIAVAPVVKDVLGAFSNTEGCLLHRLSGSGATCFGIYEDATAARKAADTLKTLHPEWWIVPACQNKN